MESVLKRHGVRVWCAPSQIRGSQQWIDEIGKALARCDWFLAVLTPHAVKSIWVKREIDYAVIHPRFNNRIIPILLRRCFYSRVHWTLESIQSVDFRTDYDDGFRDLFRVWDMEYVGSTTET